MIEAAEKRMLIGCSEFRDKLSEVFDKKLYNLQPCGLLLLA